MKTKICVAFTLSLLSLPLLATDYYLIKDEAAAQDYCSLDGRGSNNGNYSGWATTSTGTTKVQYDNSYGAVDPDGVYHMNGHLLRGKPNSTSSYSFRGMELVFDGTNPAINDKMNNNSTLTIDNLRVVAGTHGEIRNGDNGHTKILAGNWTIEAGAMFGLNMGDENKGIRSFVCAATVSGGGILAATAGIGSTTSSGGSVTLSGDLTGFIGILSAGEKGATYTGTHADAVKNRSLVIGAASAFPQATPDDALLERSIVVTNGATISFTCDMTSPVNRGWDFGDGAQPTVNVEIGKTVMILGPVKGSVGFKKTGEGTLILNVGGRGKFDVIEIVGSGDVTAARLADYVEACDRFINTPPVLVTWNVGTNGGTMDVEGQTITTQAETSVVFGWDPVAPATPSKDGQLFVGWNTDATATVGLKLSQMSIEEATTFYAIFGDSVIRWYDEDGTTELDPSPSAFADGTRPSHVEPTKTNTLYYAYTFAGWTLVGGDGTVVYTTAELPPVEAGTTVAYKAVYTHEYSDTPKAEYIAPDGFARGVVLTVDGYAANCATLTNFPVLVRVSNGTIPGFSYSDINFPAKANADICFVAEDGTPLAFDIDTWDMSANATSLVWVTLPTMMNGTKFAMYYKGQSSGKAVCGDNAFEDFVGVWHLGESGDAEQVINDSTLNELTGDSSSRSLAVPVGQIGAARTITTIREKANYGITVRKSTASLAALDTLGTSFVVSFWMRPLGEITAADAGVRYCELIGRKPATGTQGWQLQLGDKSDNLRIWSSQTNDSDATMTDQVLPLAKDQWTKMDVVYTSTRYQVFANGDSVASGSHKKDAAPMQGSDTLSIGSQPTGGERSFWGDMDEVRLGQFDGTVTAGAGSADWVKADYNQVTNTLFLSASDITEIAVIAKPLATLGIADSGAAYAQFAGQINGLGGDAARECFVRAKAWPTGTEEPDGWTTIATGLALNDTFSGALVDLLPQTPYDFKIQAVNDITEESDVTPGTFTTSGAGEIGSGGDMKRVGDSIVHTFNIAKDGTTAFEFVPPSYATSVEALVVAGGGAGGYRRGGGGGAGGLLHCDAFPVTGGATYDIEVGAGGAAAGTYSEFGGNGMPSSISSNGVTLVTTVGGGAGGNGDPSCAAEVCDGQNGGSGGGSGAKANVTTQAGIGVNGQGYAGGIGRPDSANNKWGGGGGGANSAGGSAAMGTTTSGGNGGDGTVCSISGEELYYAGGGGGGGEYSAAQNNTSIASASSGGKGGGGKGGQRSDTDGSNGSAVAESGKAGTGGGGGGGSNEIGHYQGGDGGSGIVIFRYAVQGNGQGINEPAIALESLDRNEQTGVTTVGYRLAWAGDNYDYADVMVAWGFSKDNLSNTNAIASSVIGRGTGTFTLPDQTKTVYVRAVAVNAGGYGAMSPKVVTIPFIDPEAPEVERPVVSGITGTGASFSAAVTGLGEGATSVQGVFQVSTDDEFEGTILSFPATNTLTAAGLLGAAATGLSPNTAYYVRVSATNDVPDFFETEPVPFRTAVPGAPSGDVVTNLTQVANPPAECEPPVATATTITAWGYLFNPGNNGASYANLRLEASTTANFQAVAAYTETESNVPQRGYRAFTLTDLEPETAYYLRLRMENDGRVVKYSDVVGPYTTEKEPPAGVMFLIY